MFTPKAIAIAIVMLDACGDCIPEYLAVRILLPLLYCRFIVIDEDFKNLACGCGLDVDAKEQEDDFSVSEKCGF
jgi:hypothetical protein